ncbi:Carboxypeptidase regulatory-like domain-containing protein [Filimonas lacunae]|uniref:Carboxypeptidase regulatory-like domain-containing protein n=1 Tax=Filimonas lacunae TaxID=477680 RepID=A0A173MPP7_9BACT|nr:outer membrane beta-barrel protein [Filimonas lacunae]BAV09622.1 hypothetical protein FLA_5673 [Filimonas lacunae]SIS76046.1 Carboxypeptidase regulatory-like domain-containing protein [Filimonas lacunae]
MPKSFTLLILSIVFCSVSFAQKTTVKGRIYDSSLHKGLAYATVSLVHEKDSTLVTFGRADSAGYFSFKAIDKGTYLLSTSYVGYLPVWKKLTVQAQEQTEFIPDVSMTDLVTAQNVTVVSKRPPVTMNNDTLEFNSENFKTQPNAVVEDMLKKMPGVTIESDGSVKINGQSVQKILVNGKEFFTGDPKMATKNLPADAVDKVQVFDKKSDQSEFTGVDDGNTTKTINLKLKKDRNNALFGKINGAAGTNNRYDAQTSINRFNNEEQVSLLAMANNTNKQGFSIADAMNFSGSLARGLRNGGGINISTSGNESGLPTTGLGQNQQGVATTFAGGVNYNNNWQQKTDLNTSYTGSDMHLVADKTSNTQNLSATNSYTKAELSKTISDNAQHRINLSLDQKIDSSFSLKFTPNITWQNTGSNSSSSYTSVNSNNVKLNEGTTSNITNADAVNFTGNVLLRKRLAKKGRTLSGNINTTYNHSQSTGSLNSNNVFYDDNQVATDSIINQINSRNAVTKSYGANVTYTEPVGKKSLLEFSTFGNVSIGESVKKTYDKNTGSGKYDIFNTSLSNDFTSNYTYSGGGVNFRTNQQKYNFTVGTALQSAALKAENNTAGINIRQTFTDILPNASFQYLFSRFRNMRFDYTASTIQPSVTQLQPIADISDPLNVTSGNADLKRQYNHLINMNYFAVSPENGTNVRALVSFTSSRDAIVNADSVKDNGSRSSKPVNANGVYTLTGNFGYGFSVKKLKSRFDIGSSISYNRNIAFLNNEQNVISNLSIGPMFSWNYGIDDVIDIHLSSRFSISKATYSLQPASNTNYLQQTYGGDLTYYLPWSMVLNNQFNYVLNSGRTSGFNTQVPLWNASIAKSFLKNKRAEIKLSVYDLLNKNIGITRTASQSQIVDQRYNVLNRYFLLGFTYSLNKSGLKQMGPRIMGGPPM